MISKKNRSQNSRDRLLDATFEEIYRYGYSGAGIANILKLAEVPKGSMYHHFKSKKEMVIAMINERLIPKVRDSFNFNINKNSSAIKMLEAIFEMISNNKMLISHGCPLHRLMYEMDSIDSDIAMLCSKEFVYMRKNLEKILQYGINKKEIKEQEVSTLAEFIISSTWGILSKPTIYSSKEQFLKDTKHLIKYLQLN